MGACVILLALIVVLIALIIVVGLRPYMQDTGRESYSVGFQIYPYWGARYTGSPYPLANCSSRHLSVFLPKLTRRRATCDPVGGVVDDTRRSPRLPKIKRGRGTISQHLKEKMHRAPLDENREEAYLYGDRRPLCDASWEDKWRYYGGEFGWRMSFYY